MRNDKDLKIAKRVYKAHYKNVLAFVFLQNMVIFSIPTPSLVHEREFVSTSSSTLTETEIGFFSFLVARHSTILYVLLIWSLSLIGYSQ